MNQDIIIRDLAEALSQCMAALRDHPLETYAKHILLTKSQQALDNAGFGVYWAARQRGEESRQK